MACEITYKGKSEPFHSNRELDEWMWENRNWLLKNIESGQVFYDATPAEASIANVEALNKEGLEFRRKLTDKETNIGSAGLSEVFSHFGNPSNMEVAVSAVTKESEEASQSKMDFGTAVHKHAEDIVNGKTPEDLRVPGANDNVALALKTIKERHKVNGKEPTLMSEITCVSKGVYPGFMQLLVDKQKMLKLSELQGELMMSSELNGRADLVVIDDNGDVFIYDFKTSANAIYERSNTMNEMRLASYAAMFKQHGIDVKGMGFIDFTTKWENGAPTFMSFNPKDGIIILHPGNPNVRAANAYFPSIMGSNPIKTLNGITEIMTDIVPDSTILQQHELAERTAESLKKHVVPITDSSNPNLRRWKRNANYYYYMSIDKIPPTFHHPDWVYGQYLVAESEAQMMERLTDYCKELAKMGKTVIPGYANAIKNAIRTKDISEFNDALHSLAPYHYTTLYNHLHKYAEGGWAMLDNDELIQNGIFIFQRIGTNRVEIVAMDTHVLNVNLEFKTTNGNKDPRRTSMLGSFLPDSEVDPMFFMKGTVGNAVLLKIMAYLSLNSEAFGNNQIASIKALSTCDEHVTEASNEELEATWTRLCVEGNKKGKTWKLVPKGLLMSSVHAAIEAATDIMEQSHNQLLHRLLQWKAFSTIRPDGDYSIEELENRLQTIRTQFKDNTPDKMTAENEVSQVLHLLDNAVLTYYGYYPKAERDIGPYFDPKAVNSGTNASPMNDSSSVILRQLQTMISNFHDIYKQEFEKQAVAWQNAFAEFKKEVGQSYVAADDFKYFREHWFDMDGDKIQRSMRLKSEINPYWNTVGPKEKALYQMYIKMWERFRYNDKADEIQVAKTDGSFYEIPLIRTNFKKQCEAGGIWNSIKGWWSRTKKDLRGSIFGLEEALFEEQAREDINGLKLPSYIQDLVGEKRAKAIDKNGTSYYETNMDIVFLTTLAVSLRHEMSAHGMMLITALRASSYYEQFVNNNTMQYIIDAENKAVNAKMYGRSVIDPHNRGIMLLINFMKGITSTTTLAWKWDAFVRETSKGVLNAFSRVTWDPAYMRKFSPQDYLDALKEVATSCGQNIDPTTYIMQLSHYFGMANFSGDQIVKASQTNPNGFYEVGSDALFITATWPDFCHRTAFLIAHLKHEGIWDAYGLDEKGVISYDMTKDKRFQVYLKYKDDQEHIPSNLSDKFNKEYTLYLELLKDFEAAGKKKPDGSRYVKGDLLPDGLSPRLQDGLKNLADRMYGNYDDETKSLMQQELLGSLFFQFKTYPLALLSQWFKSPTHINNVEWEQVYDKDNNELCIYVEDDGKTMSIKKYKDVTTVDITSGRAWLYKVKNGTPVEGHIQRICAATSYVLNHDRIEFENECKNNPHFRGQMAIALYDTFFAVILAFLIRLMFGEETVQNMKDEEWYTRWLYSVGTGMMQDGPVWSTISSLVGDGTAPSFSIIRTYLTNATSLLTGNTSLPYAIANTFGATRYFTSILTDE